MHRDGTLELHDVKPDRIKEEMHEITNSPDGLWFISREMIGNTRLVEKIHKPVLRWVQQILKTPDGIGAVRDPRASGKTDGITIAVPFWALAADPIDGSVIQGVNTCFVIVAPKKDIASYVFLTNIDARYEQCKVYREVFPWVMKNDKRWSLKNGLTFQRTLLGGLPTIMPLGMESVSTSLHPPILICDDPIHEQNYRSSVEVRRVKDWVAHSQSLTAPIHGVRLFIGNYWGVGDVQDQFHPDREDCAREFQKVHVWERGMTGCDTCIAGESVDGLRGGSISGRVPGHVHEGEISAVALGKPEMAAAVARGEDIEIPEGPEHIADIRESLPTFIFLTQRENILVDPANLEFQKEWIQYWEWDNQRGDLAIRVSADPMTAALAIKQGSPRFGNDGYRTGPFETIPIYELDFWMLIDPAPSEEASAQRSRFAIATLATHKTTPRQFLIDEYAANKPQHVNLAKVLDTYVQWRTQVKKIGVESVGYQATIKNTILQMADARQIIGLRESMIENLTRLRSEGAQEERIKFALIPVLESKNFFVRKDHRIFLAEYDTFGLKGSKHDLLDACSNLSRLVGPRRFARGTGTGAVETARKRRQGVGPTGY